MKKFILILTLLISISSLIEAQPVDSLVWSRKHGGTGPWLDADSGKTLMNQGKHHAPSWQSAGGGSSLPDTAGQNGFLKTDSSGVHWADAGGGGGTDTVTLAPIYGMAAINTSGVNNVFVPANAGFNNYAVGAYPALVSWNKTGGTPMSFAGAIKNLYVGNVSGNGDTTDTIAVYKNGVRQSLIAKFTSAHAGTDLVHNFFFSAGDYISFVYIGGNLNDWNASVEVVPSTPMPANYSLPIPLVLKMDTVKYNPINNFALQLLNDSANTGGASASDGVSPILQWTSNYLNSTDTGDVHSDWIMNTQTPHNQSKSYFYLDNRINGQYVFDWVLENDSVAGSCNMVMSTTATDFGLYSEPNSDFHLIASANCTLHLIIPTNNTGSASKVLTVDSVVSGKTYTSWQYQIIASGIVMADTIFHCSDSTVTGVHTATGIYTLTLPVSLTWGSVAITPISVPCFFTSSVSGTSVIINTFTGTVATPVATDEDFQFIVTGRP